ncbi:MAG: sigma-70 family RNA polymerase sigma factor [Bacteroidales bacterium]|nr:sigma-70 family RNA polymerase sigma factor [Bacteroidales bacterium]
MYALCLRYSNDREEASDVLQEGFVRIFNRLRDYKKEGSFEGWMRKIMVNTALEKYRENHFLYNVDSIDDINETDLETAEVDADNELEANDLIGMIKSLPPQYKMVFNLYAIEGYSHKEIGQMLGITVGTSKSNLSRARAILQRMVRMSTNVSNVKEKSDWKKRTY